jgi:uncharacterized protein (TIGR02145 family)
MNLYSNSAGLCNRNKFTSYSLMICFISISLVLVMATGCKKDSAPPPPPIAPTVTTAVVTNITTSGATSGGTIVSDGGATVTKSGIVWSKANATPTLTDSVIAGTTSTGPFTTVITGLDFNTTYYIRAFATNKVGTGYGDVLTLNTTNDTTKVRFTYNGQEVVYGIIISPTTGKKWLDRNLGAKRVATAFDDYQAYGDLFQWGRPADGHQLINWTSSTVGTAVNGMTNVLATSDIPGHSNFIDATASSTNDWRDDNNKNRWNTTPQGPCPAGWHVPVTSEWAAETANSMGGTATSGGMTDRNTAYGLLKLTSAGFRTGFTASGIYNAGEVRRNGELGYYWSSTAKLAPAFLSHLSIMQTFDLSTAQTTTDLRSNGYCVRCIKD